MRDIDDEVTAKDVALFKRDLEIEYQREIAAAIMNIENSGKLTFRKLHRVRKSVFFKMFRKVTKNAKSR